MTDVIPEHDELAMASHGRGFWVLDNVGPLRDYRPGMLDGDMVMFEPAPAYRSANGAVLTWWVGEGVAEALEGEEGAGAGARGGGGHAGDHGRGSGQVVRTFKPAVEGEARDRWSGPALTGGGRVEPVPVGFAHRSGGELPRDDPVGVRTMAPVVPPGTYRVRLRVGGVVASRDLVVKRNPWIEGVTDEDLVAQYEFGVRIRDQVDRGEPGGDRDTRREGAVGGEAGRVG